VVAGLVAGVEAGFAPVLDAGCVVVVVAGFTALPSVPDVLEGVGVGAGSWPGSMSGVFRTFAT
jgi:hypothetical protein